MGPVWFVKLLRRFLLSAGCVSQVLLAFLLICRVKLRGLRGLEFQGGLAPDVLLFLVLVRAAFEVRVRVEINFLPGKQYQFNYFNNFWSIYYFSIH